MKNKPVPHLTLVKPTEKELEREKIRDCVNRLFDALMDWEKEFYEVNKKKDENPRQTSRES